MSGATASGQVSHLDGALHIPLHELAGAARASSRTARSGCTAQAGYRAAVAASMLAARGRHVVAINDSFTAAARGRPGGPGGLTPGGLRAGACRDHGNAAALAAALSLADLKGEL